MDDAVTDRSLLGQIVWAIRPLSPVWAIRPRQGIAPSSAQHALEHTYMHGAGSAANPTKL